jgi:hypothetical protein
MPPPPGAGRLRPVPEDGGGVLPGVPGQLQGLHRPLYLLQVPPRLRHLGALPQGSEEALQGRGGVKGEKGKRRKGLKIKTLVAQASRLCTWRVRLTHRF